MNKSSVKRQSVTMALPTETLSRLDDYAARMELSRTAAVVVLVNQALDQSRSIDVLADLLKAVSFQEQKKDSTILT